MSSAEVADTLGYRRRNGAPNTEVVRKLAREGRIPPPIDADLPVVYWRWSTAEVERYVRGEWRAA
jgi:hypothetical protein